MQNYARKSSRENCNRDIINRLLLTSDPLLSSMKKRPQKKRKPFSSETIGLFMPETLEDSHAMTIDDISDIDSD